MSTMSRDEFEELLYYVVELKDKLNNKLDEQCAKINHQASIVNQQGQIIDELCWQLRELSEKTRELRVENRRLKTRLDGLCPRCSACRCDEDTGSTYQNHVADKYNELVTEDALGGVKKSSVRVEAGDTSAKSTDQGQEQSKVDEYSQVNKSSKKKWRFGGSSVDRKDPIPEEPKPSGNTTWYLEVESIYEPIELSAKPTTAARLEQISAEVSSLVPKPAPRRLFAARAVDNLAQYFGEDSRDTFIVAEDSDDGVMLRPSKVKQFNSESQRGSSKVACSQISDLEQSYIPSAEYLTPDNMVRFTINSRPATAVPVTNTEAAPDQRRHAIRSFM